MQTYTVVTNTGAKYEIKACSENAAWRACLRDCCDDTEYVVEVRYHGAPEGPCNA